MGGGWGGRYNNGELGKYATAASQQDILFGQHFGQINDRLTNIGNGICSLGYDMQGNIAGLGKDVALGQANLQLQASNNAAALASQLSSKLQIYVNSQQVNTMNVAVEVVKE